MKRRVAIMVALATCLSACIGCGNSTASHSPTLSARASASGGGVPQAAATVGVATLRIPPSYTALFTATGQQAYVVILPPDTVPPRRAIRVIEIAGDGRVIKRRSLVVGRVYANDIMSVSAGADGLYVGTGVLHRFFPNVPDELLRIDPSTLAIVARAKFTAAVSAVEQRQRLWAATDDGRVLRLDPRTLAIRASRRVVAEPTPLTAATVSVSTPAVGAGSLWVLAAGERQHLDLVRMDPATLAVRSQTFVSGKSGPIPWQSIQEVAAGSSVYLWGSEIVPVALHGAVVGRPIGEAELGGESRSAGRPELESLAVDGSTLVALVTPLGGPSALVELAPQGRLLAQTTLSGIAGELAVSGRDAWFGEGRRFVHVRLNLP